MKNSDEPFQFIQLENLDSPPIDGDVRIVVMPIKVLFRWSDKIVADVDSETGEILEYSSGYMMDVLPNQKFHYAEQKTELLYHTFPNPKDA